MMSSSQKPQAQNGTFWQVETPERRVSGELTLGEQPALETHQPIFDERAVLAERSPSGVVMRMGVRGSSEARVADWEERISTACSVTVLPCLGLAPKEE